MCVCVCVVCVVFVCVCVVGLCVPVVCVHRFCVCAQLIKSNFNWPVKNNGIMIRVIVNHNRDPEK